MVQKLLLGMALLFSSALMAQDPDLLGNWQLTEIIIDGETFIPPSDSEVELVSLIITPSGVESFTTDVCNTQSGEIAFSGTDTFTLSDLTQTLGGCLNSNSQSFELLYFQFFYQNAVGFEYTITDLGNNIKRLTIMDNDGNTVIYHSELLRQYVFKTYYLQRLIIDDVDINVPADQPFFNPSISFEQTFDPSVAIFSGNTGCTNFNGTNTFVSNERVVTITDTTIGGDSCQNQVQTDYEALYRDFLFGNVPQTFSYLFVEPSEGAIFYLSRDGNYAVYGESPVNLNIPEFIAFDISITPNPATDRVTFQTEISVDQLQLYNVLGNRILSQKNQTNTIDISSLSAGVYFVEVVSSQQRSIQKLIKK